MTIQQKFEEFDQVNPHIYQSLVRMAESWLHSHTRVGIGMLWEVLRWHLGTQTEGDIFKLNNDFRSRYARKILAENPHWKGRITTRELRSA